jgi:cytochrome c553
VQQTNDIKGRARVNGYTGMMQPAVLNITDEQIAAIAAYLTAQSR